MKFYWFNKKCCVPECFNSSTEGEGCYKEFFDLPAEPQSRARWLKAILSTDGENLKICEDHFREDDVFRDKNHRKKLRLNSIPSQKLPQNICNACLGSTRPLQHSEDFERKMCQCVPTPPVVPVHQTLPEKRIRLTWTADEKRTLFKAIKKHGDVKVVNNHIRINWNRVFNNCRDRGCFGNEKELKNAWQYLRTRAAKVFRNEVYGTKLERKVSRFLFGKGPKLHRVKGSALKRASMEDGTSDDEFNEELTVPFVSEDQTNDFMTDNNNEVPDQCENDNANNNLDTGLEEMQDDEDDKTFELPNNPLVPKVEDADTGNETCSESDDEYYSIEDVRDKLGIKIAPKSEVISLISSDEAGSE